MSFYRFALLTVFMTPSLPLLNGDSGKPLSVVAASQGVDGASLDQAGMTPSNHPGLLTVKSDCASPPAFCDQKPCRDRGDDHDPFHVTYNPLFGQISGDGIEDSTSLHPVTGLPALKLNTPDVRPTAPAPTAAADAAPLVADPVASGWGETPSADPARAPTKPKAALKKAKTASATEPDASPTQSPIKHKTKAKKAKAVSTPAPAEAPIRCLGNACPATSS